MQHSEEVQEGSGQEGMLSEEVLRSLGKPEEAGIEGEIKAATTSESLVAALRKHGEVRLGKTITLGEMAENFEVALRKAKDELLLRSSTEGSEKGEEEVTRAFRDSVVILTTRRLGLRDTVIRLGTEELGQYARYLRKVKGEEKREAA